MVIEASVLVIGDDEEGLVPLRTISNSLINVLHESLSFSDTVVWMLVVHQTERLRVIQERVDCFRGVDETVVREGACSGVLIELLVLGEQGSVLEVLVEMVDV